MLFSLTQLAAPSNLTVTRKLKYVSLKVDPAGTAENPLDFVTFVRYPTLVDANADTNRAETFVSDDFSARDHDDLTPGTTYYYRACWVDIWGNESALASEQHVTWKLVEVGDTDQTAPATPAAAPTMTGLTADIDKDGTIDAGFYMNLPVPVSGVAVKYWEIEVQVASAQGSSGSMTGYSKRGANIVVPAEESADTYVEFKAKQNRWIKTRYRGISFSGKKGTFSPYQALGAQPGAYNAMAGVNMVALGAPGVTALANAFAITWNIPTDPTYDKTAILVGGGELTRVGGKYFLDTTARTVGATYSYTVIHYDRAGNATSASPATVSPAFRQSVAAEIADGILSTAKFASTIKPVELFATLPTTGNVDGRMVYNTTDKKLYRYDGTAGAFTTATAAADVTGQLTNSQIADLAATKLTGQIVAAQIADAALTVAKFASTIKPIEIFATLAAAGTATPAGRVIFVTADNKLYRATGSAWTAAVAAGDMSGQLTDTQIADLAATKLTGQVVAAQIADAAITAAKFASGLKPVEVLAALPGSGNTAGRMVFLTTDNKLYRYNGSSFVASVPSTDITGTLTDAQLAAISAAKITGQVVASQIADASISTAKFAAGLTPVEVLAALPGSGNFAGRMVFLTTDSKLYRYNGSAFVATVATADLSGTITDAQLAGIAASKITGQLTDAQIAALAAAKLTGQITTTQITDDAITTPKVAAGAITATEIAANTITAAKIAAGTITATEIAAATITGAKIAAATIAASNLVANTITAAQIAAGTITTTQIAADTIVAGNIAAGAVSSSELAAGAVIAGKIAAGTIVAADIAAATITGAKIAADTITAANILAGTVTATEIAGSTITGTKIAAGTITAGNIAADTITAGNIAAGAIGASEVAANAITAKHLLVMDTENLIQDFNFDQGTFADIWDIGNGTIANYWLYTGDSQTGKQCLILDNQVAGGTGALQLFITTKSLIPVTAGATLAWEISRRTSDGSSANGLYYRIYWFDRTGAALGSPYTDVIAAGTIPTQWTVSRDQVTVPAGATYAKVRIYHNSSSGTRYLFLDRVSLRKAEGASLIVDGTIITAHMTANTIDGSVISANTLNASKLVAGSITTDRMTTNTIGGTVIQDGTLSASKIVADSITAGQIAAGAISSAELAAGAVIAGKIAAGIITATEIAAATITGTKIAADTITAANILAGTITATEIAGSTITGAKIAANTITSGNIAANTITAGEIAAGAIATSELAAGAITASKIAVATFSDNLILGGDFEDQQTDMWTGSGGTLTNIADTSAPGGGRALQFNRGVTDNTVSMNRLWNNYIPVEAGDTYFAEFTIKGSGASAAGAYLRVLFYDGNKAAINDPASGLPYRDFYTNGAITTTYTARSNTYVIPVGTKYVLVQIYHHSTSTIQHMYVSNVTLKKMLPGSLIVNGTITANQIAADAITTAHISSITLDAANAVIGNVDISNANIGTLQVQTINLPNGVVIDGKLDPTVPGTPGTPTLASITADIDKDGTIDTGITATWTAPASGRAVKQYRIEIYRRKGDKGTDGNNVTGYTFWQNEFSNQLSHSFKANAQYFYKVRIYAISVNDVESTSPSAYTTVGKAPDGVAAPSDPAGVSASAVTGGFALSWTLPTAADHSHSEVCVSQDPSNPPTLNVYVGAFVRNINRVLYFNEDPHYVFVRHFNKSGQSSNWVRTSGTITPVAIGPDELATASVETAKLSSTAVTDKIVAIAAGAVGSHAFLKNTTGSAMAFGSSNAASGLAYSSTNAQTGGGTVSGTWLCLGSCPAGAAAEFLRIS